MNHTTTEQGPTVRGGDDIELARRLGHAIREAMGELTQTDLARASGIDQPTISKLIRGIRLTPMTVWEMLALEKACKRPTGWILQRAGYLKPTASAADAIMGEDDLPIIARRMLVAALGAATTEAGDHPEQSTPTAPADDVEHLTRAFLRAIAETKARA